MGDYRINRIYREKTSYHRHPRVRSEPPSVHVPNYLQRQFMPVESSWAWVVDITYIRAQRELVVFDGSPEPVFVLDQGLFDGEVENISAVFE